MALIKYVARTPPNTNLRTYIFEELRLIQTAITSLAHEAGIITRALENVNGTTIEIGPPDSAGPGYRTLKIPN